MNCDLCQGEILTKTNQVYHYKESGLGNLYLTGITVEECQKCGDISPWLPKLNQLHRTIARAIVMQPKLLSGQEIRFLRTERLLKPKDFATLLSIDPATLSRWENNQQHPSTQNDAFIRTIYVVLFNEQMHQLFPDSLIRTLGNSNSSLSYNDTFTIIINTSDLSYIYKSDVHSSEAVLSN